MSVSPWQIIFVILLLLVLFGARRLPALGKSMGEALRNFKKSLDGQDDSQDDSKNTSQKES